MIKVFIILLAAFPGIFKDYKALNKQAEKEYQVPIRPGYEARNPFWNGFSKKFTYAPAFDFKTTEGAVKYRFTVTLISTIDGAVTRGDDDSESAGKQAEDIHSTSSGTKAHQSWTFEATTPQANLSPIWKKLPVGNMELKVEALAQDDSVIKVVGERKFLRDFPFVGPYHEPARPYVEAARMALLYIHQLPAIQYWKDHTTPDMTYKHNTYPNKIIGSTVRAELRIAELFPEYKDEAVLIARNAAQFLIDQSKPEGHKLAYFPPTYYGDLIASKRNKGLVMTMDPCMAASAFLDFYDYTGEKAYYDRALNIVKTYQRLQREDGSIAIKLNFETGEPVNKAGAMLTPLMNLVRTLQNKYHVHEFDGMLAKAEKWMNQVALETFDLTGQFEDVSVDVVPYQNLTNCTASPYASYLLSNPNRTKKDVLDARDLIAMSEDQFVHWSGLIGKNGVRRLPGPCVFEQHRYQTPVDASSCNVANAYMDLYEATGDKLALAKATELLNMLTITQNSQNGCAVTTVDYRELKKDNGRTFWLNCSRATIEAWLRLDGILKSKH